MGLEAGREEGEVGEADIFGVVGVPTSSGRGVVLGVASKGRSD
jgi:hypothetical protein